MSRRNIVLRFLLSAAVYSCAMSGLGFRLAFLHLGPHEERRGREMNLRQVEKAMQADTVRIDCHLGLGKGHYTALTCDLTREYITINADYTT